MTDDNSPTTTDDEQTDELGDFDADASGGESAASTIAKDEDAVDELDSGQQAFLEHEVDGEDELTRQTTIEAPPEPIDPLADDFRLGDPAIDLANGRAVLIVGKVADRTDDHSDDEGYDFLENYGNRRLRSNAADPVYEAVYVSSLQSKPSKSYDFPSSRLGRAEYENVDGVERVYEMVALDLLDRMFQTAKRHGDELPANSELALANIARWSDLDVDVDEAEELARAAVDFEGSDE